MWNYFVLDVSGVHERTHQPLDDGGQCIVDSHVYFSVYVNYSSSYSNEG